MTRRGPKPKPLADRLWPKVDKTEGCWLWTAAMNGHGYGRIWSDGKFVLAHRATYELLVGEIPDGMDLDHLCRTPACVNPDHLEPVPHRVNVLRGGGATARNARKEECVNGHPFTDENTIVRHYTSGRRPSRQCRTCRNKWERERKRARRKEMQ